MGIGQILGKLLAPSVERSATGSAERAASSAVPHVGVPAGHVSTGFTPGTGNVQQINITEFRRNLLSEANALRGRGYSPRLAQIEKTLTAMAQHDRQAASASPVVHAPVRTPLPARRAGELLAEHPRYTAPSGFAEQATQVIRTHNR